MPDPNSSMLSPIVEKLAKHTKITPSEAEAISGLPYRLEKAEPGTYLVREGDKANSCIAVISGFTYRSKVTGSGARQILSINLRGDLVDLQNSMLEQADHSVQALTYSEVAYITHRSILALAQLNPGIAQALWRDTLVDGSVFREWLLNVGQRNARQRVAHLICELALRQEQAGLCKGPDYEWPITQEQIGDATGLTAVHVNRTIQQMRTEKLIAIVGRSLTIIDWPTLRQAGDFKTGYLHHATAAKNRFA